MRDQRRTEGSLLNWFERLIRRRRESPEIGHGRYTGLPADDPAVLAHRCDWRDRAIVAVHNLADRPARLDLARVDGGSAERLIDLFGTRDLVAGEDGTLRLDLEPYGHRWFAVEQASDGEVDTGAQSREDLYERAKAMGIRGRSTMSKSELEKAVGRG